MLQRVRERPAEALRVVDDQVTTPTWAVQCCRHVGAPVPRLAIGEIQGGVYHVANAGECSWYAFACAALDAAGLRAAIEPVTTTSFGAPAPRASLLRVG